VSDPGAGVAGVAPASVAELLRGLTSAHPERPALVGSDGEVRLTYAELVERSASVAAGLLDRGLCPGDRVAVLVRDREEALIPAVAVLWAGGTLIVPPVARGWRAALAAAAGTRPAAVFADPATWLAALAVPGLRGAAIRVVSGRRRWPGLVTVAVLAGGGRAPIPVPVPRPATAPALVTWTTGTTGPPRAIVRSHGVLASQHAAMRRLRSPRPDDVDLAGLPNIALHDLACGIAVVMPPRITDDHDGAILRATVARAGVTTAAGFPAMFERLVEGAGPGALPRLRAIHVGGAPVRRGLLERLALVAPDAAIVVVYGATEAEPIAAVDAREVRASGTPGCPGRGLLAGRPIDGVEVRLVRLDGPVPVAAGGAPSSAPERGRIVVRGARVARVPGRTDADGWLDTGDVGAIDAGGRIWLLGRAANALAGGDLPADVEEPVAALEGVGSAAVVALAGRGLLPSRCRLLRVLAVEPSQPAMAAVVRERVSVLAARRGWDIDQVVLVQQLPRDGLSGKIDYPCLRALVR
jgi:acyl-CoA synthetase (AMP-forming)/AMP-acid ligase II